MNKLLGIIIFVFVQITLFGQKTILIDGYFEDWEGIEPISTDESGDGQNNGIDIRRVWVHNDEFNIYFRFELTKEITLQENNDLAIYLDYDNQLSTGFKINGIGAEIRYFFGERFGVIENSGQIDFVNFMPLDMLVAPTVSSDQFEVAFARDINEFGINFSAENQISFRIEDNGFNGDEIPNDLGGVSYDLDLNNTATLPEVMLERPATTDFRLLSYNIKDDQLFDISRRGAFQRIFRAINPDIIALQEVRDFSSEQTRDLIETFLPIENWYHKKHGFDIVTLSRYPIVFSESIVGNAAFYIEVENDEVVLLINCHLPCCENDSGRQAEVDQVMEYVRDIKVGDGNYPLAEGSPIMIAGDMNFVGDSHQPYTFLTGDIFSNSLFGPDFHPDWDDTDLSEAAPHTTNTFGSFTWLNPNGSFFPGKLDWVFYTDSRISVLNTFNLYTPGLSSSLLNLYNLQSNDVINASDHMPVVVDFGQETVNVDDIVELDINIYPNPTSDYLYMNGNAHALMSVKILNQMGETMKYKQSDSRSEDFIRVNDLPSGSYFLIIQTEKGRIIKPFLKVN